MDDREYQDREILRRLLRLVSPYWAPIGGVFALSILSTPLALLTPWPLKIIIDSVIGDSPVSGVVETALPAAVPGSDRGLLVVAVGMLVFIHLLTQLQTLATTALSESAGERMVLDFRSRLFRHAQRLSLAYHDTRGTSDSTYRIQYDAPAIRYLAIDATMPLVTAAFTLAAMVYVIARIDRQLAVVALAIAPVLFSLSWLYRHPLRRRYRVVADLQTTALSVVQEALAGARVVKAFGTEDVEQRRLAGHLGAGMRARIRLAVFEEGLGLLTGVTTAVGTALVLFIGVGHVQDGTLTLGELLIVMAYLAQLYVPLTTISGKAADIQGSLTSIERTLALLDEHPDVPERLDPVPLARARGAVTFRDVSFGYDAERSVLRGISFHIDPGARVGISGTTGAGKSTLASLLVRFYDPTEGTILLDGLDLREYQLASLRRQFAIVLQEPMLFSTSIGENIAYARPGATGQEIAAAARDAGAHDFIVALPEGYATQVGERGMQLSGGERQRISLARAFLKDAPILILDEPTSSVDVVTEAAIMEAMQRLMRGRTTFMIAHRLSTLELCDVRFKIERGTLEVTNRGDLFAPQARSSTTGPVVATATRT